MKQRKRIVFGIHAVEELMRARRRTIDEIWVSKQTSQQLRKLADEAKREKVRIVTQDAAVLDALTGFSVHQGVVALTGEYKYCALEDLLEGVVAPLLVVVDGVTDPQNLGAIFRSAAVFGATGVVLTQKKCAKVTPAVVRVSAGATERLPCAQVVNLARTIETLKKMGIWVVATVEAGGTPLGDIDLRQPTALVLGNEQSGVRQLIRKKADYRASIPSASDAFCALNVAAAATVALYEVSRQRRS